MRRILFVRAYFALMLLGYRFCHRESYTVSAREASRFVCSVKTVEQTVKLNFTNRGIGVLNRQSGFFAACKSNSYLSAFVTILNRVVKKNSHKAVKESLIAAAADVCIYIGV